jgi:hypothetical protein
MWKWIKKEFNDFLASSANDWEMMKRGTYAGLFPLIIMAAAAAANAMAKKKAAANVAKEQNRANSANLTAQYEHDLTSEQNREDDRLARTGYAGSMLKGNRALSPDILKAALTRRRETTRKGTAADKSKGLGWQMIGDLAQGAGNVAASYQAGKSADAGMATSLRPAIGGADGPENCPGGRGDSAGCF